jgi:hypothetical protein
MYYLLFATVMFFSFTTQASIPGLSGYYTKALVSAQINALAQYPPNNKLSSCQQQIVNMSQDHELTIFVGLGYMDFSRGQDFVNSGTSLYQFGEVLDLDAKIAFEKALTRKCSGTSLSSKNLPSACGFRKSKGGFSKKMVNKFTGKRMNVFVKVVSSAYSSNDQLNKTTYAQKQNSQSQYALNQFQSALQSYDAVFYLGHARSGGGPDFFPPRLLKNGHVDYGYYKQQRPGLNSMLQALQGSDPSLIGLLACKSTGLFAASTQKHAPHSALITADNLFDFSDLIPTGFLAIEALVSQRCNENFSNVVKNQSQGDLLSFFF